MESKKLIQKQNKDINQRMNNVMTGYVRTAEQLSELEKLLNPDNQYQMTRLCDFTDKNYDIPFEVILGKLVDLKYLKIYYYEIGDTEEFMYITKKPYTDYVIIPSLSDGKYPYLAKSFIVISKDVEEKLQEYCNTIRIHKKLSGWG